MEKASIDIDNALKERDEAEEKFNYEKEQYRIYKKMTLKKIQTSGNIDNNEILTLNDIEKYGCTKETEELFRSAITKIKQQNGEDLAVEFHDTFV